MLDQEKDWVGSEGPRGACFKPVEVPPKTCSAEAVGARTKPDRRPWVAGTTGVETKGETCEVRLAPEGHDELSDSSGNGRRNCEAFIVLTGEMGPGIHATDECLEVHNRWRRLGHVEGRGGEGGGALCTAEGRFQQTPCARCRGAWTIVTVVHKNTSRMRVSKQNDEDERERDTWRKRVCPTKT